MASGANEVQHVFTWLDQMSKTSTLYFYKATPGIGFYSYLVIGK